MSELVDAGRPAVFFGFAAHRMNDRASDTRSSGLRRDASLGALVRSLTPEQLEAMRAFKSEPKEKRGRRQRDR